MSYDNQNFFDMGKPPTHKNPLKIINGFHQSCTDTRDLSKFVLVFIETMVLLRHENENVSTIYSPQSTLDKKSF